ncbi:MAG: hypothetical protein IT427_13190 [Pirellulales bacterium]|nr:hypothetical protein [Pirellulales bacterium]
MNEFGYFPPVAQLLNLGETNGCDPDCWPDYLAMGFAAEHVSELTRMATDARLDHCYSDRPEVWAPIHARRTLGQLRAASSAERLLAHLASRLEDDIDDSTMEELPVVLGMFGEPIIPQLVKFIKRRDLGCDIRAAGARALVEVGQRSPDSWPQCVAALAELLENFTQHNPTLNSYVINDLVELKAIETLSLIERAYQADAVDVSIIGDFEEVEVTMGVKARRVNLWPVGHFWGISDDRPSNTMVDGGYLYAQHRKNQRTAKAKAKARRKQQAKQSQQSRRRR